MEKTVAIMIVTVLFTTQPSFKVQPVSKKQLKILVFVSLFPLLLPPISPPFFLCSVIAEPEGPVILPILIRPLHLALFPGADIPCR